MPTLYMMIGLPGSGKGRYAKELAEHIYCLSEYKDILSDYQDRDTIYNSFCDDIKNCLAQGKDCVYDAVNAKSTTRIHFLRNVLKDIDCRKVAVVMATPYLKCVQNAKVPKNIVETYLRKWETPILAEGFDEIWLYYDDPAWMTANGDPYALPKLLWNYNQESKYHMWSLGGHLEYTQKSLHRFLVQQNRKENYEKEITYAAVLHDCGKPFTKEYDKNNKVTYYNHNNVGGYEVLFFDCGDADKSYISALVCHHMAPYFWEMPKTEMKFQRKYGHEFYLDIMALHGADVEAH